MADRMMQGPINCITYEHLGIPIELLHEEEWRSAIRRGRLGRTVPVRVDRHSSPPINSPAEDVPELRSIFDEQDALALAAPPAVKPHVPQPSSGAVGTSGHEEPGFLDGFWGPGKDFGPPEPEDPGDAAEGLERGGRSRFAIAAVILLLVVSGFVAWIPSEPDTRGADTSEPQVYRVVHPAYLRQAPVIDPNPLRILARNQKLIGTLLRDKTGRDWLRITADQHAGLYVWTGNLELVGPTGNDFVNMTER